MTLNNIKTLKEERGFTIVELLIVIVVIGILAAIVIVAYTGVTNNARNANYKANAASIQKVAEAINADNGSYPLTVAAFTTGSATTKLPNGITTALLTTAPTNDAAFNTARTTDADLTTGVYSFDACGTAGLKIYYPIRGASAAGVINIGDTSTGC